MALVPWVYNNPRVELSALEKRQFLFRGELVEVFQDIEANIDATKNTALKLWDGAYLLSRYVEHLDTLAPGCWDKKRVIELGSGCGLVGIVAWLFGADVTLTDLGSAVEHTRRCVGENIKRLAVDGSKMSSRVTRIRTNPYSWGDDWIDLEPPFDVILGSDIVYQPESSRLLLAALKLLCGLRTLVFISYKPRGLGEECFFTDLKLSFDCQDVSMHFNPVDFLNSDYNIYKISRRPLTSSNI